MPDNDRPSSAPLSQADADRLSERFTASWDEPIEPPPPVTIPKAAPVPKPKHTLLGIAPIIVGPPAAPPAPPGPAAAPPAPLAPPGPAAAPPAPPGPAAAPLAPSVPLAAPPAPPAPSLSLPAPVSLRSEVPTAPLPPVTVAPPESSSSPTATAVTTPSKPYIPKDHPSTPAVVISGDVVAEAERNEERARTAQTLPGQTRSNPLAAPPPSVPVPLGGFAPPAVVSSADDEYPPLRRSGSKWPLVLGAVAVLGAGAFVVAKLGSSAPAAAPPPGDVTSPAAAPLAPDIAEPARAPEPAPAPEPAASEAPPVPEPEAAPEPVAAKPTSASKPVRKTTVAPQRRPTATKAAAPKATSASEPATQSKSKGVIVRETPF